MQSIRAGNIEIEQIRNEFLQACKPFTDLLARIEMYEPVKYIVSDSGLVRVHSELYISIAKEVEAKLDDIRKRLLDKYSCPN